MVNLYQSKSGHEKVSEVNPNGSRYEGQKLNGERSGTGLLYYVDGGYYEGEWKHNQMNGIGKLFYQSGKIAYEGNWVNDKFDGWGAIYNEHPSDWNPSFTFKDFDTIDEFWKRYEGYFRNDSKEGFGKLFFTNGEYFEGNFKDDIIEGNGTFKSRDGTIIKGKWVDNKLIFTF